MAYSVSNRRHTRAGLDTPPHWVSYLNPWRIDPNGATQA